jgi:hypothetical protein
VILFYILKCFENLLYADSLIIATVSFIIKMTYFMASALEKGLQLASRILQASWLELIYDPLQLLLFHIPKH